MKINKRKLARISFYLLFGLLLLVLQTTIVPSIAIFEITPSLLLIAVVVIGAIEGNGKGALFGAILGFSVDVISSRVIGMEALYFMLCGFFSEIMCEYVLRKNVVTLFFVFGCCIFAKIAFYFVIYIVVMYNLELFYSFFIKILLEAVYSLVFLIPFFIIIRKWHQKFLQMDKY